MINCSSSSSGRKRISSSQHDLRYIVASNRRISMNYLRSRRSAFHVVDCLHMGTMGLLFVLWIQSGAGAAKPLGSLGPDTGEFRRVLMKVLSKVKLGEVASLNPRTNRPDGPPVPATVTGIDPAAQIRLPGAMCRLSEVHYTCTWETAPNKYSVAVLLDQVAANVSASVPGSWTRNKGQTLAKRWAEFVDPGKQVVISVRCPVTNRDVVLDSYTVTLVIHRTGLEME